MPSSSTKLNTRITLADSVLHNTTSCTSVHSLSPKRILIVGNDAHDMVHFRGKLLQKMCALGLEVHAALPSASAEVSRQLNEWGIQVHKIPLSRAGLNPIRDTRVIFRLTSLCRELRINCVLSYTIKPVLYASIAARLAGIPNIYSIITGLGYAFAGKEFKRRILRLLVIDPLYRVALRLNSRVLFLNQDDMNLFKISRLLPDDVPVGLLDGEGVDLQRFQPCPLPDAPSFLLIGRLLADKGIREYVSAARIVKAQHPSCRFRLVGGIDECNPASITPKELSEWVDEGVIEYLGKLNDVRPAIRDSSVYVLPSYREGMPVSILEAMAMGRSVITTDAPGCRDTVPDGLNGFLVPVRSVMELAAAMQQFVHDPELSLTMGKESLHLARSRYDVRKVTSDILSAMSIEQPSTSLSSITSC
jgi:glycosyltransferase involved in cell wall biosynthesis